MKFKNIWIEKQLPKIDERLKAMLFFLDYYVTQRYNKEIMITELIRTQAEQDIIYKDDPKYKKGPKWASVHQYGRGADLRVSEFTLDEIKDILDLLNKIPYGDGRHKTALIHNVGFGDHIHIQVRYINV